MNHRDDMAIQKIVSELDIAEELLYEMTLEEFMEDERTKRAVCMTVINVGELVKVISEDIRVQYKQIAWREAAGFRDIAAHKYQTLNMADVYMTVKQDFPNFKRQLEKVLLTERERQ